MIDRMAGGRDMFAHRLAERRFVFDEENAQEQGPVFIAGTLPERP